MVKDLERNGSKTPETLVAHMANDHLVLWGRTPGGRHAPVPMPHKDFIERVETWLTGGAACPS
jgi:hypothetical protein